MRLLQVLPVTGTEAELIARAQSADTDAFCQLASRYERRIYSLALHYCHDPHDAEDLSQEVWLKAYQAIVTFRGEASFYTWIRKITINCFLNSERAKSSRWRNQTIRLFGGNVIEDGKELTSVPNSEATLPNRIIFAKVMRALSHLTSHQRLIFLLKNNEGI